MTSKFKIVAFAILGVASILLVVLITVTIVHNYHHVYSASLLDFALFGDFMAGTLGVIISTMSLGVSILIAYFLQTRDNENNRKAVEAQKHIAIMQFRHSEVSLYRSECDKVFSFWDENMFIPSMAKQVGSRMDVPHNRIISLFPELTLESKFPECYSLTMVRWLASNADHLAQVDSTTFSNVVIDSSAPLKMESYDNFKKTKEYYYKVSSALIKWANQ